MGSKETNLRKILGVPEDSQFIYEEERIVGIKTTDGSFDYTDKGKKFLGFDVNKKTSDPKLSNLC